MDHEELVRLSGLARGGDIDARNRIVEANLGLVHAVVGRCLRSTRGLRRSVADRRDLFQDGVRGLIRAAELWDPGRGTQFSTYAVLAIRTFVAEAMGKSQTVAPASNAASRVSRWRRMAGRGMSEAEIAAAMGLSPAAAARVKAAIAIRSLAFAGLEDWGDDVIQERPSPLDEMAAAEERSALAAAFEALDAKDRGLMMRRHGLDRRAPQDEKLTARWLGCSVGEMRRRAAEVEGRLAAAVSA